MLKYNGYTATLKIDVDSGLLLGHVVDVNDSITFQAKTIEEASQEFHQAVDSYLRVCTKVGKPPDKPFSGKMPFRTKPKVHKAIYLAATRANKSMNAWMEEILYGAACQSESRANEASLSARDRGQFDSGKSDRPLSSQSSSELNQVIAHDRSIRINLSAQSEDYQRILASLWAWLDIIDDHERLLFDKALQQFVQGMEAVQPFLKNETLLRFYELIERIYAVLDVEATTTSVFPMGENLEEKIADVDEVSR